jgi:hypothetical protein
VSVAQLLNVPVNDEGWQAWTFAHAQNVTEIRQAVLTQKNIRLTEYILDPVDFKNDLQNWLLRVQQSHNEFNDALNLPGLDLQDTDVTDDRQRPSWIYNMWLEVSNARFALKI